MIKKILLTILCALLLQGLYANVNLDVKIYTGYSINSVKVQPLIGKYSVYENDKLRDEVLKTETIEFSVAGDSVLVRKDGRSIGMFMTVTLSGAGLINSFLITPLTSGAREREYDDDLRISVVNGVLQIINHVDLEDYIAGVVQSEGGGSTKENEFYIVQAICCRTYALNNSRKHVSEGYNLCDSIHCQLYSGKCKNPNIQAAVFQTAGDVIVDKNMHMISAAFHSNSGGMTANSEDVWSIETPYLKSVVDTFSLSMTNARWEKTMSVDEWLNFLKTFFNYPTDQAEKRALALNYSQDQRKAYFDNGIRLADIRKGLGLRSAYFSVKQSGDQVVFYGKGYGHGVGLSQQGAIRMAQLGYGYRDIIKFYYKDVEIMSYEQVMIRNY